MLNRFFCLVFLLLTSSAWASLASETNAEGRIEWSADYSAWGERQHSLPLDAEEAAASGTDCALRFQGQYFDGKRACITTPYGAIIRAVGGSYRPIRSIFRGG
jgi:hypothetical protein